jgi:hypothetical protein
MIIYIHNLLSMILNVTDIKINNLENARFVLSYDENKRQNFITSVLKGHASSCAFV